MPARTHAAGQPSPVNVRGRSEYDSYVTDWSIRSLIHLHFVNNVFHCALVLTCTFSGLKYATTDNELNSSVDTALGMLCLVTANTHKASHTHTYISLIL